MALGMVRKFKYGWVVAVWMMPLAGYASPSYVLFDTEGDTGRLLLQVLFLNAVILLGIFLRVRRYRLEISGTTSALQKSRHQLQLMVDNLPHVMIFELLHDRKGRFYFSYLCQGLEDLLGVERQQIIEHVDELLDRVHPEDKKLFVTSYQQAALEMIPLEVQVRIKDQHGEIKWGHICAVPHTFQRKALAWSGFVMDITERKALEDMVQGEKISFENLFDTIDDFLLVCDLSGIILHQNPAVLNRLEYTVEELRSLRLSELYAEKHQGTLLRTLKEIRANEPASCDLPLRTKEGCAVMVDMHLFLGMWNDQPAIFCVARDVAGRREAENALRDSERMLQLIMDTIPMAVYWKDHQSRYQGCNQAFVEECGLDSREQVVGKTPNDLFPDEMAKGIMARDQQVMTTIQPLFNYIQEYARRDGTLGWRETSQIPLDYGAGKVVGVLGVWRDITEKNLAEERLKRTLEDMERFNQLMRGRERRTLELKAEVNRLLQELGRPPKYRTISDVILPEKI